MTNTTLNTIFFISIFIFFFFNNANLNGYSFDSSYRLIPIDIVGPLTILICFYYIYKNKLKIFISKEILKKLSYFIISLFFISLFRSDMVASLRNFTAVLITYIVVVCISTVLHQIPFFRVIKILIYVVSFVLLPFNLYIQASKQGGFSFNPDRGSGEDMLRFGGALYHAHNGMVLGFVLLLLIYLHLAKRAAIIDSFLIPVIIISIILTDCRSVWGGVFLCTALMLYSRIYKKINKIIFSILVFVTLIFGVLILVNTSSSSSNTLTDFDFRQLIWLRTLNGIAKQPLIGYGTENFFQQEDDSNEILADSLNDPHNSFLDLVLQYGIPTSVLLIQIFLKIFNNFKALKIKSELYVLFIFWIFVPFFWGGIYKGTTAFITFFFPLTLFAIFLHPDLIKERVYRSSK